MSENDSITMRCTACGERAVIAASGMSVDDRIRCLGCGVVHRFGDLLVAHQQEQRAKDAD